MTVLVHIAVVLLRASLALFPARYRREYGEERLCVLHLALEGAAAGGAQRLLQFCAREGRDLPLALLQEYSKEWRLRMNGVRQSIPPAEEPLSGRRLLLFLVPFIAVLIFTLRGVIWSSFLVILILGLVAVVLGLAVIGLAKSLPRWALPSLGLVLSLLKLLVFTGLVYATPGLTRLKQSLWTDYIPGRVLYAVILALLDWVLPVLLLVVLALLSNDLPALAAFRQRLGWDWTLLPFLLYTINLMTPFYEDPYRGLEPYQLIFLLILSGGAWLHLRASRPPARLAALLVATLLSGLVLALGIYQIYPAQSWVQEAISEFPRWWEALLPLLNTLALLAALCVTAAFGAFLRRGELPDAPASKAVAS